MLAPGAQAQDKLTAVNKTGHTVVAFFFADDNVHENEAGGVQFGKLTNGQSGVAKVPGCHFAIMLADGQDIWHWVFHE